MVAQFFCGVFNLKKDATGPFEEDGSCFRKDSLASHPMEKLVAQLAFELYYLLAKRWLSNI